MLQYFSTYYCWGYWPSALQNPGWRYCWSFRPHQAARPGLATPISSLAAAVPRVWCTAVLQSGQAYCSRQKHGEKSQTSPSDANLKLLHSEAKYLKVMRTCTDIFRKSIFFFENCKTVSKGKRNTSCFDTDPIKLLNWWEFFHKNYF